MGSSEMLRAVLLLCSCIVSVTTEYVVAQYAGWAGMYAALRPAAACNWQALLDYQQLMAAVVLLKPHMSDMWCASCTGVSFV
jgi:hypothetical protein